jgi:hypothetical protein
MKMKRARLVFFPAMALAGSVEAAPMTFAEVSLLVRMHEREQFIAQEVAQRHLLRALTGDEEARLKAQGAPESLVAALRQPEWVLPAAEATAFEAWRAEQDAAVSRKKAALQAEAEAVEARRAEVAEAAQRAHAELAAQEQARAEAKDREFARAWGDGWDDGYYGYGAYGGEVLGAPRGGWRVSRPGHAGAGWGGGPGHGNGGGRGDTTVGGSLQWSNGTAKTFGGAGLSYYPLGTNGGATAGGMVVGGVGHGSGGHGSGGHGSGAPGGACAPGTTGTGNLGR